MPKMSVPGSPSTIQLASTCPIAPPCENPPMQPHAAQKLRRPGTGPTSGLPSGVNVNAPFTHLRMPAFSSVGKRENPISSSGLMRSMSSGSSSMP